MYIKSSYKGICMCDGKYFESDTDCIPVDDIIKLLDTSVMDNHVKDLINQFAVENVTEHIVVTPDNYIELFKKYFDSQELRKDVLFRLNYLE